MAACDIYGFAHEDLDTARKLVENALSICLEEAEETMPPSGTYFRGNVSAGPTVQLRRNSGPFQRWQGSPSHPWHLSYGLLIFVHGPNPESIREHLQRVPDLVFLEHKEMM
jgi:hypothetical protein